MAPPERFTESQIEELLQRLARAGRLEDAPSYAKSELVEAFGTLYEEDAESLFAKFRHLAQTSGRIGAISVSVEGTRKWRTYTFDGLASLVARRDPTAPTSPTVPELQPEPKQKANDHPEDRTHLAAHAALLLSRNCVGISLPKVSGARSRGSTKHENPDYIGVRTEREVPPLVVPAWLDAGRITKRHSIIGAEIKANIGSPSDLSSAIRQTLHNSRYFDERWLVAPIASNLHTDAAVLGEEYNVGIIALSTGATMRHQVLWNARPVGSRIRDFLARYEHDDLAAFCERFDVCRRVSEKLSDTVRADLLRQLLTDQREECLLLRLPASVSEGLESEAHDENASRDIEALAICLRSALVGAYEYDAPEEQEVSAFVSDNLENFMRSTSVPVSQPARRAILSKVREYLSDAASEAKAFVDAIANLSST